MSFFVLAGAQDASKLALRARSVKQNGVRIRAESRRELAHGRLGEEFSLLRSKNEYPSAEDGQSGTPVPTNFSLHSCKSML